MTINDLAELMVREFARLHERFNAIEERLDRMGKFPVSLDNRHVKIEYTLDESDPRQVKVRIDRLEHHTFGTIQSP